MIRGFILGVITVLFIQELPELNKKQIKAWKLEELHKIEMIGAADTNSIYHDRYLQLKKELSK